MALYTYDAEADALYVLLSADPEPAIDRTEELSEHVHVDLDADGSVVGVEFFYPRTNGIDDRGLREHYGVELDIPFSFAA